MPQCRTSSAAAILNSRRTRCSTCTRRAGCAPRICTCSPLGWLVRCRGTVSLILWVWMNSYHEQSLVAGLEAREAAVPLERLWSFFTHISTSFSLSGLVSPVVTDHSSSHSCLLASHFALSLVRLLSHQSLFSHARHIRTQTFSLKLGP